SPYLSHICSFAQPEIEDFLSVTQRFRCYFEQFICINEIECLLQTEDARRREPECLVGTGGTRVGQMLCLADIELDIFGFSILADDHAGIYFFAGTYEQCTTLLRTIQSVSDGFSCFESDER